MNAMPPGERASRFVFCKRHIAPGNRVKSAAFIPYPYRGTSVSLHAGRREALIWGDGDVISLKRGKPLLGRADFSVQDVLDSNLRLEPDPRPDLPFHAEIVGWPLEKAAQKNVAMTLAARAFFAARR